MLKKISGWLGKLSVGKKLTLIYLLDLTAVIYVSSILIQEKYLAIDFARKEVVSIGGALGFAVYPTDGGSMDTMLHVADQAMYDCKTSGLMPLF